MAYGKTALLLIALAVLLPGWLPAAEIHDAIKQQDMARLDALLAENAAEQVNARVKGGSTPLHWAVASESSQAAEKLLRAGADINATTANGSTALHWAAHKNTVDVGQVLLENGADVNAASDKGYTPLHWAAIGDSPDMVRLLVAYGATVNRPGEDGFTALHCAVRKDAAETVKLLFRYGADPRIAAADGTTAAAWVRNPAMRSLLAELEQNPPDVNLPARPAARHAPQPAPTPALNPAPDPQPPAPPISAGSAVERTFHQFPDGSRYEGQWLDARFHGIGTLMFADGETYTGMWRNGLKHGRGIYTFPDGENYAGQWQDGVMQGSGVYTFANGGRLEGQWRGNRLVNGTGTFVFADGDRYDGQWRNDRMWGRGAYTRPTARCSTAIGKPIASQAKRIGQRLVRATMNERLSLRRRSRRKWQAYWDEQGCSRPIPTARDEQVLLPDHVPLPLRHHARRARPQLHHRRRGRPLQDDARLQRALAHGLGRLRPARRERRQGPGHPSRSSRRATTSPT